VDDVTALLTAPVTKKEWSDSLAGYFSREQYCFPGGFILMKKNSIVCQGKELFLAPRESLLIFSFLSRSNRFLSLEEIDRILGIKALKVYLSRLRRKLNNFLSIRCPLGVEFHSVKCCGYYLGITVDNLWITL
jgi:DNA-binding response OmpR family regulator